MSQIVIVTENGLHKPHFRCEHCGKLITEAALANICWNDENPEETKIVCKSSACNRPQPRRLGGDCWMDLKVAWVYAGHNGKIDYKKAKADAKLMQEC